MNKPGDLIKKIKKSKLLQQTKLGFGAWQKHMRLEFKYFTEQPKKLNKEIFEFIKVKRDY